MQKIMPLKKKMIENTVVRKLRLEIHVGLTKKVVLNINLAR